MKTKQIEKIEKSERQVARPLKILVPLINEDIRDGDEAGLPYYIAAGEKLLEAKASGKASGEIPHGDFMAWSEKKFGRSFSTMNKWMQLAKGIAKSKSPRSEILESGRSMRSFIEPERIKRNQAKSKFWQDVAKANPERMTRILEEEKQSKADKAKVEATRIKLGRELAHRLIKLGRNALALQLHPDKGGNGSNEAMSLLNDVASYLRGWADEYQG